MYSRVSVIVLAIVVLSCQQSTVSDNHVASVSDERSISESETIPEIPNEQEESEDGLSPLNVEKEVTVGNELSKISFQNASIDAHIYAFDQGYSFLKYKDLYFPIAFNYTYDTDFESAVEDILVFKSEKYERYYLLLPTYTEEFSTYQLLYLESDDLVDHGIRTMSMKEFEKSLSAKGEESYFLFEHENKVFLSLHKGKAQIDFDVIYETEERDSEKLEDSHLEQIQNFSN